MHKKAKKYLTVTILLLVLFSCIDKYVPELKNYESLLVVEGLITDEQTSYTIKLSRTMDSDNITPVKVSDATVWVSDDSGSKIIFNPEGEGIYKSDPEGPTGMAGREYVLHIRLSDGKEYVSDQGQMYPVPEIDRLYFEKDEELSADKLTTYQGIQVFIDAGAGNDASSFLRWEYEETWKFNVPFPKKYSYVNDSVFVPLNNVSTTCWKTNLSGKILTGSIIRGMTSGLKKEPVCFIPSDRSDRLSVRYSIEVKQYSVSSGEFDYWNKLKQVNELGGDIFDSQPFPVSGNLHNVNDPLEKVLGFFQVSAVKKARIFISATDLASMSLPVYKPECEAFIVSPENYPPPNPAASRPTFDDIYNMFIGAGGFNFVEPQINPITKKLEKLVFATVECSDCELTGTSEQPDFWTDH